MDGVKLNDAARDDLAEIWEYIAQHNPEAADRIIRDITAKFATLRRHPHIGKERNYLLINLRSFPVRSYIVFYQPIENGIEVFRVLHGAMDIDSEFERFFDSLSHS